MTVGSPYTPAPKLADHAGSRSGTRPAEGGRMRFSLGTALVFGVLVAPVAPRALAQPTEGGAVGGVIAATGKLFDVKTGAPVTKATIAIEGSDQPIRPAEDGTFTIPSVALGATLVITADGYEVSLVTVDGTALPDI